ncbi:MAG: hypothetical protein KDJ86_03790 [Bauldia sp.]|uniref:hypothetical protein n=1 Tax=Bauldia sp. TaxID=2575872 RepID=UPI001DA04D74|nr:hypothetical protein [Bauldia sp.]MCB1494885.1 hypothetical protein [Bauldia sp.]
MLLRTIAIAAALAFAGATAAPIASTAVLARDKGHAGHSGHKGHGEGHHDKTHDKHGEKNRHDHHGKYRDGNDGHGHD